MARAAMVPIRAMANMVPLMAHWPEPGLYACGTGMSPVGMARGTLGRDGTSVRPNNGTLLASCCKQHPFPLPRGKTAMRKYPRCANNFSSPLWSVSTTGTRTGSSSAAIVLHFSPVLKIEPPTRRRTRIASTVLLRFPRRKTRAADCTTLRLSKVIRKEGAYGFSTTESGTSIGGESAANVSWVLLQHDMIHVRESPSTQQFHPWLTF